MKGRQKTSQLMKLKFGVCHPKSLHIKTCPIINVSKKQKLKVQKIMTSMANGGGFPWSLKESSIAIGKDG